MFIVDLFIGARNCKKPRCPSTEEKTNWLLLHSEPYIFPSTFSLHVCFLSDILFLCSSIGKISSSLIYFKMIFFIFETFEIWVCIYVSVSSEYLKGILKPLDPVMFCFINCGKLLVITQLFWSFSFSITFLDCHYDMLHFLSLSNCSWIFWKTGN